VSGAASEKSAQRIQLRTCSRLGAGGPRVLRYSMNHRRAAQRRTPRARLVGSLERNAGATWANPQKFVVGDSTIRRDAARPIHIRGRSGVRAAGEEKAATFRLRKETTRKSYSPMARRRLTSKYLAAADLRNFLHQGRGRGRARRNSQRFYVAIPWGAGAPQSQSIDVFSIPLKTMMGGAVQASSGSGKSSWCRCDYQTA